MSFCKQLHDDPVIRALLWCLISDDELNEQTLRDSGLSQRDAGILIRDEDGLLRRMCVRATVAERFSVKTLAMVLRARLLEHLEQTQKASELSSILRSLKALPDWMFPEWKKAAEAEDLQGLRQAVHAGGTAA